MTNMLHHPMVGILSAVALLSTVAGQAHHALAQPGAGPAPGPNAASATPPMPVPPPLPAPADPTVPGPAPVFVPAGPLPSPMAPPFTNPQITSPSTTAPIAAGMTPSPTVVDDGENGPKSPSTALGYAALGSLAGPVFLGLTLAVDKANGSEQLVNGLGVLSVLGFFAGPSAGRWYVEKVVSGPLIVRAVSAGLVLGGVVASICLDTCGDNPTADKLYLAGFGVYVASVIYDLVTVREVARDYNRSHRGTTNNLTFAPMVKRSESNGATTTGLMLGGSF